MGAVRDGLTTLVVGAFFGFLVTSIGAPTLRESPALGATGESSDARAYMLDRLANDPTSLLRQSSAPDVAARALKAQTAEQARGHVKTVSLTYLGGSTEGRIQVQIYAVELQFDQTVYFYPFALTLVSRRVVLVE